MNNTETARKKIWRSLRKKIGLTLRLGVLFFLIAVLLPQGSENPYTLQARVLAAARGQAFDYVNWEVGALWQKAQQELWGVHAYIPEENRSEYVLTYFDLQRQVWDLEKQLESATSDQLATLEARHARLETDLRARQALTEHIIEGQVSSVLRDEGLAFLGQVIPPVTMHFLKIPDVLVVSPRHEIRQAMTLTLQPMTLPERIAQEKIIAAAIPEYAVWITPIGGVGVYPSMIRATDRAVVGFEVVAHEWTHHYLIVFPLGYEYFSDPETRIINETTATLVGNEIGNRVIERFYAEDLAAGRVYLQTAPDYRVLLAAVEGQTFHIAELNTWNPSPLVGANYPTLHHTSRLTADYLLAVDHPQAAQLMLDLRARQMNLLALAPPSDPNATRPNTDQAGWISHTRLATDYLLSLGRVEAAELVMENGRQQAGLRVLNQAWFAFNVGYQDNPIVQTQPDGTPTIITTGGGGDPIGAAIYEIRARAGSLKAFLEIMRGITSCAELLETLEAIRLN